MTIFHYCDGIFNKTWENSRFLGKRLIHEKEPNSRELPNLHGLIPPNTKQNKMTQSKSLNCTNLQWQFDMVDCRYSFSAQFLSSCLLHCQTNYQLFGVVHQTYCACRLQDRWRAHHTCDTTCAEYTALSNWGCQVWRGLQISFLMSRCTCSNLKENFKLNIKKVNNF